MSHTVIDFLFHAIALALLIRNWRVFVREKIDLFAACSYRSNATLYIAITHNLRYLVLSIKDRWPISAELSIKSQRAYYGASRAREVVCLSRLVRNVHVRRFVASVPGNTGVSMEFTWQ